MKNFLVDLLLGTKYFFAEGYIEVLNGFSPFIGYCLIFSTIVNCILTIFPLQIGDPNWELSTISQFLGQIWGLLVGFGFVLLGFSSTEDSGVGSSQIAFLKTARWLSLLLAFLFVLAVPWILVDSSKLVQINIEKSIQFQNRRFGEISNIENKVQTMTDVNQIKQLAQQMHVDNNGATFYGLSLVDSRERMRLGLDNLGKKYADSLAAEVQEKASVITKKAIYNITNCIILALVFLRIWSKIGSVKVSTGYYDS